MGQTIEDENTHPIFLRNRHRGYTHTSCDGFFATWTTQKSSRALNRPESTFFRTENRAVMGFSQTGPWGRRLELRNQPRSRIFDITSQGYRLPPTPLNTNTRPPNNGGDAFPNGTSPLYSFQASPSETAYRRTNTNVSRSEMPADPMGEHHNPDPNSRTQRKLALVRAARLYAKQYTWRTKKDPLHSDAEHRRATRNLLRAASSLPRSQHRRTIGTEHGKPQASYLPPAGCRTRIPNQSFQRNPRAPPGYCGQLVQHRKPAHETAPQHARSVKVSGSDLALG